MTVINALWIPTLAVAHVVAVVLTAYSAQSMSKSLDDVLRMCRTALQRGPRRERQQPKQSVGFGRNFNREGRDFQLVPLVAWLTKA